MTDDEKVQQYKEREAVKALGETIGYGNIMHICEGLWREYLGWMGAAGGELTVGTCAALLVPCRCVTSTSTGCDWCEGTGRVTKRVSQAQKEEQCER